MAYSGISGMLHVQDLHSFVSYLVREYTSSERPVYLSRDFNSCLLSLEHLDYLVRAGVNVQASVNYHFQTASQTQEPQKGRDDR